MFFSVFCEPKCNAANHAEPISGTNSRDPHLPISAMGPYNGLAMGRDPHWPISAMGPYEGLGYRQGALSAH